MQEILNAVFNINWIGVIGLGMANPNTQKKPLPTTKRKQKRKNIKPTFCLITSSIGVAIDDIRRKNCIDQSTREINSWSRGTSVL